MVFPRESRVNRITTSDRSASVLLGEGSVTAPSFAQQVDPAGPVAAQIGGVEEHVVALLTDLPGDRAVGVDDAVVTASRPGAGSHTTLADDESPSGGEPGGNASGTYRLATSGPLGIGTD